MMAMLSDAYSPTSSREALEFKDQLKKECSSKRAVSSVKSNAICREMASKTESRF
jgi:hypothetical protein